MDSLFSLTATATTTAPITERHRPRAIADFVGLDKVKRAMARLVANPLDTAFIFHGDSGTGKTTMALAVAAAIPAELVHIPSQACNLETIERLRHTCQYMPAPGFKRRLVLVDEADKMTTAAQIALLSLLDSTGALPGTVVIFTANSTDGLEPRFLSRLHRLEFSSYGMAPGAAKLLERAWDAEVDASAPRPNFARLVKESNTNIRAALMALETEMMCA